MYYVLETYFQINENFRLHVTVTVIFKLSKDSWTYICTFLLINFSTCVLLILLIKSAHYDNSILKVDVQHF